MAIRNVTGSVRKLKIEGIAYRIAADADMSQVSTIYENSMIPTSGASMRKMVKRVPERTGINLIVNSAEMDQLKAFSDGLDLVQITYTVAAGARYMCKGTINIENVTTQDGKMTVSAMPETDWTYFPE